MQVNIDWLASKNLKVNLCEQALKYTVTAPCIMARPVVGANSVLTFLKLEDMAGFKQ